MPFYRCINLLSLRFAVVHLRAVQDTPPAPCITTKTAGKELPLALVANREHKPQAASAQRLKSKIFITVRAQQLMSVGTTTENDTWYWTNEYSAINEFILNRRLSNSLLDTFLIAKERRSEFKDKMLLSTPYPVFLPYSSQDCFSDLSSVREVH